jgi:hypothetical protein
MADMEKAAVSKTDFESLRNALRKIAGLKERRTGPARGERMS